MAQMAKLSIPRDEQQLLQVLISKSAHRRITEYAGAVGKHPGVVVSELVLAHVPAVKVEGESLAHPTGRFSR